ncbi:MAG: calcium-translocating P-type ATPase, PMCA-type [Bacteroidales bacterium]|jgi:Ca2+-transporting ATPase|nr:calcium-translocating P-type ATPase, PMCA-type [Bacteroidales bacterium]
MQNRAHRGLNDAQVAESRKKYGMNVLKPPKKRPVWMLFFEKFNDPIIKILLIALALSVGVSCYQYFKELAASAIFFEPFGIFVAILLATGVGFIFELNANKKFDILNKVNDDQLFKVIRNGNITEIMKKDIVVGDVVILDTGDEIPADGILLEAVSLQVNESTLTGEPAISKTTDERNFKNEATYPSNEVMKGTTVVDGHAIFQVVKVGDATEYGKVYQGSQIENDTDTPLNIQLSGLAGLIAKLSYGIAITLLIVRLLIYFTAQADINWLDAGVYILDTLMIAITLVVVSVPEGLPMSIVLSLALSMKRMLATNNLVRKMHACETMGAVSVICTDKTGTLTQNQMQVHKTDFWALQDQELSEDDLSKIIKEGIAVNSTAYLDFSNPDKIKVLGNPTEGALLLWLHERNENYLLLRENAEILEQLTFSTERKFMATVVHSNLLNKKILYVKGAPEITLSMSDNILTEKGMINAVTGRGDIERELLQFQEKAMRTLGFAYKILDDDKVCIQGGKLVDEKLTCIGVVAIADPVRKDVSEAIQKCMNAGITVKIVTGDTPGTAKEIGRQIGLWKNDDRDELLITGPEFTEKSDEELLDQILDLKIIARARPMDKERLVRLLQQKNQVVAVTGDGTNDAPALNAAQVGLSMGDGTRVAKEASAITILDNSFTSIVRAVMWGRSLHRNIQRFLMFQVTVNLVACLIVLIGAFLGAESPLTVTQMLWVNLIMDTFAAMALASLPPNEKVMNNKPRKSSDFIISKAMMLRIIGIGFCFVAVLFGLLQVFKYENVTTFSDIKLSYFFQDFLRFDMISNALTSYELTMFFTIFVMLQFWNLFNARTLFDPKSALANIVQNRTFWAIVALIIVGQMIIVTFGGEMFNVQPLSLKDWIYIIVSTSLVLWIGEIYRFIKRLK